MGMLYEKLKIHHEMKQSEHINYQTRLKVVLISCISSDNSNKVDAKDHSYAVKMAE